MMQPKILIPYVPQNAKENSVIQTTFNNSFLYQLMVIDSLILEEENYADKFKNQPLIIQKHNIF